jgi:hypothetical protein
MYLIDTEIQTVDLFSIKMALTLNEIQIVSHF